MDGQPYQEIGSFRDKVDRSVTLRLRRTKDAPPVDVPVTVNSIQPNKAFTAAIVASIRTIEYQGANIGYVRMWSFTSDETRELIKKEVGSGRLKMRMRLFSICVAAGVARRLMRPKSSSVKRRQAK